MIKDNFMFLTEPSKILAFFELQATKNNENVTSRIFNTNDIFARPYVCRLRPYCLQDNLVLSTELIM